MGHWKTEDVGTVEVGRVLKFEEDQSRLDVDHWFLGGRMAGDLA